MPGDVSRIPVCWGTRGSTLDPVQWAEAGDDDAYGKAIQIDGRILVGLRYFAERYAQARLEGDRYFLRMVANKTDSPGYRGRIKQKSIWFVVALLDLLGLLETMSGNELLDFCNDIGANDGDTPIEDVTNMLKRVRKYKCYRESWADVHAVSTPVRGVVKNGADVFNP